VLNGLDRVRAVPAGGDARAVDRLFARKRSNSPRRLIEVKRTSQLRAPKSKMTHLRRKLRVRKEGRQSALNVDQFELWRNRTPHGRAAQRHEAERMAECSDAQHASGTCRIRAPDDHDRWSIPNAG